MGQSSRSKRERREEEAATPAALPARTPLWIPAALSVLLAAVVFASFAPTLDHREFLNWDDDKNFTENPSYRGLGMENIKWMFSTCLMGHYHPVTWLTLGFDYVVWGMDASGYRLTSLVFHAANTVLLFFLVAAFLNRTGANVWKNVAAAAGALFWGIHPLRVESVAWITERRDVVCGFFFLLTLLAYLRMVRRQEEGAPWRRWLVLSSAFFALSLLSKALGILLPFALLAVDLLVLGRFRRGNIMRVLLEKIPFLILIAADAAVMRWAMTSINAVRSVENYDFEQRIMQAAYGLCFYPWKTVLPTGLYALYTLDKSMNPWEAKYILCLSLVTVASVVLLVRWKRWPHALAAWTSFAVLVAPVLGLAVTGMQITADRYSYLSCMPWSILLAAAAVFLAMRCPLVTPIAAAGLLLTLSVLTFRQTGFWENSVTLWTRVIRMDPKIALAWDNRGEAYRRRGESRAALTDHTEALRVDPRFIKAYNNRGNAREDLGDSQGALEDFSIALNHDPENATAYNNRACVKMKLGDLAGALADFEKALELKPDLAMFLFNRSRALMDMNQFQRAADDLSKAIQMGPVHEIMYNNRGYVRERLGDLDGAGRDYEAALRMKPDMPNAHFGLGSVRLRRGDRAGAIASLTEALRLYPPDAPVRAQAEELLRKARSSR